MASFIRIGVGRLSTSSLLFAKGEITLSRAISSKLVRSQDVDKLQRPAPWNYKNKPYNQFSALFDRTSARFDENSKVIVVEGPLAAGKSQFAKELAEELDMLYLPEANQEMIYINNYGIDLRKFNEELPEACRTFDIGDFLKNPKHQNTAAFQIRQYQVKFSQYVDALAHVLSTGQGVVLDRCCYSDFVFAETMFAHGYLSKPVRKSYYEFKENTIDELLRPHLVIYLDVPVPTVQENIKKRKICAEINSSILTDEYLTTMEKFYKQHYLKQISKHAELLVYDWSEGGEVEIVVEDIERISFKYDLQDPKMKDWVHGLEEDWALLRHKYADKKHSLMSLFNVPTFHIPELCIEPEDFKIYHDFMKQAPGEKYAVGYNTNLGDKGLLFKSKSQHRDTLPLRERTLK